LLDSELEAGAGAREEEEVVVVVVVVKVEFVYRVLTEEVGGDVWIVKTMSDSFVDVATTSRTAILFAVIADGEQARIVKTRRKIEGSTMVRIVGSRTTSYLQKVLRLFATRASSSYYCKK